MPEIPEMEIYQSYLNQYVSGKHIQGVEIHREKSINLPSAEFVGLVQGQEIKEVRRRAKTLIFLLGNELYLVAHMMLDGRLYLNPHGHEPANLPGQPSVAFTLGNGDKLFFCGLNLGYLHLLNGDQLREVDSSLGVEPLSPQFTREKLGSLLKGRRGMLKPLLMNQKVLAGLGNAYTNEALFVAGIRPDRGAAGLAEEEVSQLFSAIPQVLKEAIAKGGYIEEAFAPWDNFSGGFIPSFKVYDRTGEPCLQCHNLIQERVIGGRNSFYCSHCQH